MLTAPVLHLRQSGTASVAAVDCISVGLHLCQLCKFTCGRPISTRQLRQHHNMWHLRSLEMMKKKDVSLFDLWGKIFKGKESNFYFHTNSFYCTFVVVVFTRIPRSKFLAPPLLTTCSWNRSEQRERVPRDGGFREGNYHADGIDLGLTMDLLTKVMEAGWGGALFKWEIGHSRRGNGEAKAEVPSVGCSTVR